MYNYSRIILEFVKEFVPVFLYFVHILLGIYNIAQFAIDLYFEISILIGIICFWF